MRPISPRISKYPISIALPDMERLLPISWPLFEAMVWGKSRTFLQRAAVLGGLLRLTAPKGTGESMWFKAFVLLRIPISAFCLIQYVNFGTCGGVMVLGMLALLVYVSICLVQFRDDALILASVLLMMELGGGVLMMAMGNYFW